MAQIIYQNIQSVAATYNIRVEHLILVDHGSPVAAITEVRMQTAIQLQSLFPDKVMLSEAAMERREGKQYDFNGELLEDELVAQAKNGVTDIIVAMMFFLPGRHAGNCGDVDEICSIVMKSYPSLNIMITPLIAEHELLLLILKNRLTAALKKLNA